MTASGAKALQGVADEFKYFFLGANMSGFDIRSAKRAAPDRVLADIADYVMDYAVDSDLAYETAHYCLLDTLACGFQALDYPACTKLLGPVVPGAPPGSVAPGTTGPSSLVHAG